MRQTWLGPWQYLESKGGKWFVYDCNGDPIQPLVCVTKGRLINPGVVARARLIAKSPEMYELLQRFSTINGDDDYQQWLKDCETLLNELGPR